jgi:predicted nucleic acid-binding protein
MRERKAVYDTGVLIAIDKRSEAALRRHERLISRGDRVIVPAVAAAQVIRRPAHQARLMLALRGADIEPFTKAHHVAVGKLLADSGTSDVVDAFVVLVAARTEAAIYTSDVDDIKHLVGTLGVELPVLAA